MSGKKSKAAPVETWYSVWKRQSPSRFEVREIKVRREGDMIRIVSGFRYVRGERVQHALRSDAYPTRKGAIAARVADMHSQIWIAEWMLEYQRRDLAEVQSLLDPNPQPQ